MSAPLSTVVGETVKITHLLSACLSVARSAGSIIRSVYSSGRNSVAIDKSADPARARWADPQTEADVRAQNLIVSSLKRAFPTLDIIGEEDPTDPNAPCPYDPEMDAYSPSLTDLDSHPLFTRADGSPSVPTALDSLPLQGLRVWVDPLDGTREYTLGNIEFVTTLVGVSYRGKALAGVVHVPFKNQTLFGAVGVGVAGDGGLQPRPSLWPNAEMGLAAVGLPASAPSTAPSAASAATNVTSASGSSSSSIVPPVIPSVLESELTVVTSRSHMTPTLRAVLDNLKVGKILQIGGAGSKGVCVLTGGAHAYVFPQGGTKRWDSCAVHALVTALGGRVTDAYGGELDYACSFEDAANSKGVLATLGCPHSRLLLSSGTEIDGGQ